MKTPENHENSLRILRYLAGVHAENERAETPLVELQNELGLSRNETRRLLVELVKQGLVQADLFPLNVWAVITPEGLRWADAASAGEEDSGDHQ